VKVNQITTCDEGITNPKRSTFGVTLALRWGDVLHPLGSDGNWFKPPYFTSILRFYSYIPLPFISWNLWGWRGYLGAKVYGADSDAYKNWMPAEDVYEGSQAIQFSGRLSISD
jgi:hypothetical protein